MFINKNIGVQSVDPIQHNLTPVTNNQSIPPVTSTYKTDSVSLNPLVSNSAIPPTIDPNNPPQQPPVQKPSFFNKPEVRLAGMAIAGGAVFGAVGYFAGSVFGSATMGASIGVGLGVIAPLAVIGYALYKWGKG